MKILTTTMVYPTPDRPDQGVFVQRRVEAVARYHPVQVVSPQPWCPLLRRTRRTLDIPSLVAPTGSGETSPGPTPPVCYPRMFSVPVLGWATDGFAYAATLDHEIQRLRRAGQPPFDLIDAHFEYPDAVGAWLAARRNGLPVVVTLRGKLPALLTKSVRRAQIRAMLRNVDALIAVSDSLARMARELAGSDLRVDVIPNGVDTSCFHPVSPEQARVQLGWSLPVRHVLCVGHYQALKGFDRLVEALPRVRQSAGDVHLVLVGSQRGESAFQRRLQDSIATSPAGHAITCLDAVDSRTLNLMYNAADLTLNASRSEGWCNAISESLAAGTPVVATDVGGNREQIACADWGIVVSDRDPLALSRGIVEALARTWNRDAIAAHGGQRGWEQVGVEVIRTCERAIAHRRPAPVPSALADRLPCGGGQP